MDRIDIAIEDSNLTSTTLVRYPTPEALVSSMFHITEQELTEGEICDLPWEEFKAGVVEMQMYGFSDPNTNTVHVWIGPNPSSELLLLLLGHELGHLSETHRETFEDEAEQEEKDADRYGAVVVLAHRWLAELTSGQD